MIPLKLHKRFDLTDSPSQAIFRRVDHSELPLPAGSSIVQAFDETDDGLLLLGESGTGKSTLLLELALVLFERAHNDENQCIPVIFNIASWAIRGQEMEIWLVEELHQKYHIPRQQARSWLQQDQLLPLLDGLDEVEKKKQADCIKAINKYKKDHCVPLVVCSRSEYQNQKMRLILPSTVVVQPLMWQQVQDHLRAQGEPMAAVHKVLQTNQALRELVTRPLFLNTVLLAYRGKAIKDVPKKGSRERLQRQVFENYIQRTLEEREPSLHFSSQELRRWLIWLAYQLQKREQSEFYLERLQPDWLPVAQLRFYRIGTFLVFGLGMGLVVGLLIGLSSGLTGGKVVGLVLGLLSGLFSGLMSANFFSTLDTKFQPAEVSSWSYQQAFQASSCGITFGLVGVAYSTFTAWLGNNFFTYVLTCLFCMWFGELLRNAKKPIQLGKDFFWSRKYASVSVLIGAITGWLGEIVGEPLGGLKYGLQQVVSLGALLIIIGGYLTAPRDEIMRSKPNEGIQRSGKTASRLGLFIVLSGMGGVLLSLIGSGYSSSQLIVSLITGTAFVAVGGLVAGLNHGGEAYIKHYLLRYTLWRNGDLPQPWNYARFLNDGTRCLVLSKSGGSYRFIHKMFLEYFASLNDVASIAEVKEISDKSQDQNISDPSAKPPHDTKNTLTEKQRAAGRKGVVFLFLAIIMICIFLTLTGQPQALTNKPLSTNQILNLIEIGAILTSLTAGLVWLRRHRNRNRIRGIHWIGCIGLLY